MPKIPGILLGFKKQFAPMILDGSKRHTMRGESKVTRRVGGICHNYYALCTKQCELLGRWRCTRIERVEVNLVRGARFTIAINGTELRRDELLAFAYADGFRMVIDFGRRGIREVADIAAMERFWVNNNGLAEKRRWRGQLIHWDYEHPLTKEGLPL